MRYLFGEDASEIDQEEEKPHHLTTSTQLTKIPYQNPQLMYEARVLQTVSNAI
jgi:hypothetical protein